MNSCHKTIIVLKRLVLYLYPHLVRDACAVQEFFSYFKMANSILKLASDEIQKLLAGELNIIFHLNLYNR